MTCRTLRVRFLAGDQLDYEVHLGGFWTYQVVSNVPCLVVRPGPGRRGGVGYSGRYEIPLMNVAHVELLPGRSC